VAIGMKAGEDQTVSHIVKAVHCLLGECFSLVATVLGHWVKILADDEGPPCTCPPKTRRDKRDIRALDKVGGRKETISFAQCHRAWIGY